MGADVLATQRANINNCEMSGKFTFYTELKWSTHDVLINILKLANNP